MVRKVLCVIILSFSLIFNNFIVFAQETKYPDYSYEFLGEDRWENINRKVFN